MTVSAHARPPSARRAWAALPPLLGGVALLALVSVSLLLAFLPLSASAIRVGGLSLGWWYAGIAAPLIGWALTVWACAPAPPERLAGGSPAPGPDSIAPLPAP